MRGHGRLWALARWWRGLRLLVLEGVWVGPGYASDPRLGPRVAAVWSGGWGAFGGRGI
ncbi:hypothetical protein TSC_c13750 [Thermus scotoductus SA-01]|uniref:Uncharacterized protein n=1 Tax=Thermus scotoductus (strain ATCC 700910 / SA-01) TaxID=743525 RepID=E8PJN9_THESS|nr:hypothetical protein TSC_c13750 [Thermus scotoductus SA-01]